MEPIRFIATPDRAMQVLGCLQYCISEAPLPSSNRETIAEIAQNLAGAISTVYPQLKEIAYSGFDENNWASPQDIDEKLRQFLPPELIKVVYHQDSEPIEYEEEF